jgi:hypothetical protein
VVDQGVVGKGTAGNDLDAIAEAIVGLDDSGSSSPFLSPFVVVAINRKKV